MSEKENKKYEPTEEDLAKVTGGAVVNVAKVEIAHSGAASKADKLATKAVAQTALADKTIAYPYS
ncbi:MAG: hypothetical protein KBT31_03350, partial [Firmicutes bacterium]|nr:hypothetical protein [Candidatus Colimorpha enterica]